MARQNPPPKRGNERIQFRHRHNPIDFAHWFTVSAWRTGARQAVPTALPDAREKIQRPREEMSRFSSDICTVLLILHSGLMLRPGEQRRAQTPKGNPAHQKGNEQIQLRHMHSPTDLASWFNVSVWRTEARQTPKGKSNAPERK